MPKIRLLCVDKHATRGSQQTCTSWRKTRKQMQFVFNAKIGATMRLNRQLEPKMSASLRSEIKRSRKKAAGRRRLIPEANQLFHAARVSNTHARIRTSCAGRRARPRRSARRVSLKRRRRRRLPAKSVAVSLAAGRLSKRASEGGRSASRPSERGRNTCERAATAAAAAAPLPLPRHSHSTRSASQSTLRSSMLTRRISACNRYSRVATDVAPKNSLKTAKE